MQHALSGRTIRRVPRVRAGALFVLAALAACGPPAPRPRIERVPPDPHARSEPSPAHDAVPPAAAPDAGPAAAAPVDALDAPARAIGFAELPAPQELGDEARHCGDYDVVRSESGEIRIVRGARIVRRVRSENIDLVDWCFDVTGDGVPDLELRGVGTVHEPVHYLVVSLGATVRTLLDVRLEFNRPLAPVDADSGAPWPLVGRDREETAGGLCEAILTAVREPVVFALRESRYVRATADFPDLLRSIRAAALASADQPAFPEQCQSRYDVLATSLTLGDWPAVRDTLPPGVRAAVDAFRADQAR